MPYGTAQRAAFSGLVIGFLMCATGAIAPFWQQGSISINTFADIFKESIPFIGDYKVVQMYGGLWWFCVTFLGKTDCRVYDFEDDKNTSDLIIRIACVVNVLLTLLCALVALCRNCCCAGGKTVCHGVMAFLAGAAGIVAGGIFAGTSKQGFNLTILMSDFGWAFYVYIIGAAIVTFVSFVLCFASPNNPFTPMIINAVSHVMPNNRYTQMSNECATFEETERFTEPQPYTQGNQPQSRP
jgi:hypothetical protein